MTKVKNESLKEIIIEEETEVIGIVESMLDAKDKVVIEGYTETMEMEEEY